MNNDFIDIAAARSIKNDHKGGFIKLAAPMEHKYKTNLRNCQVKSFQENNDLKKAETAAQKCFQPYLKMQQQSLADLSPVKRKFLSCMKQRKQLIDEEGVSQNMVFKECLTQYKREIPRYNGGLGKLQL